MHFQHFLQLALLAGSATAAPFATKRDAPKEYRAIPIIEKIMPASVSCDGKRAETPPGKPAGQCRTATQASEHFIAAFQKYQIYNPAEMATVLAITGFECADLQYKYNLGNPGQGTSNQMMPKFIAEYAASIPELAEGLKKAGDNVNMTLDLVTPDEYNFGSGAWFYSTKCSDEVKTAVKKGDDAGWASFHTNCIGGVDGTIDKRIAYWNRAKEAFSLNTTAAA